MDVQSLGRILLLVGLGLMLLGGILLLFGRLPILSDLGRLPGDLRFENHNLTCLIPLGTMLLLSIVLTLVVNILIRLINRP